MKKLIFILFACLAGVQGASAQSYYESSSDIYGLGSVSFEKKWSRHFYIGIGSQLEAGLTFSRRFGNYFAWDVWGFQYAYDYTGGRCETTGESIRWNDWRGCSEKHTYGLDMNHEISPCRTGLRFFSPKFNGNMKAYLAVGCSVEVLGATEYDERSLGSEYDGWEDQEKQTYGMNWSEYPGLRVDIQAGIYLSKKWGVGYQANIHRLADYGTDHSDHMVRLTYIF